MINISTGNNILSYGIRFVVPRLKESRKEIEKKRVEKKDSAQENCHLRGF